MLNGLWLPPARMPFSGPFRGATWNAQALFARRAQSHHEKLSVVNQLLLQNNFVAIQETHGTEGAARLVRLPASTVAFWSHDSQRSAGVGLVVQKQFLQQFHAISQDSWIQVEPGRAAILRLKGPQGSLDIGVVYLATGNSGDHRQRSATLAKVAVLIGPVAETLTLLVGDFNYVCHARDRATKATVEWSGVNDAEEEQTFQRDIAQPNRLTELQQEAFTCDNALARSRLDRVYCNAHVATQLDRRYICAALQWPKNSAGKPLSAHRPVAFSRQCTVQDPGHDAPLQKGVMLAKEWPFKVALRFNELRVGDSKADGPLRRLHLLKIAIKEVSRSMHAGKQHDTSESTEDKLGWTLRFIRSAEDVRVDAMERCAVAYPALRDMAGDIGPNVRNFSLEAVREHATELARTGVIEDLAALDNSRGQTDLQVLQRNKEHILTRLKRLVPGSTSGINALQAPDGQVTTDRERMGTILSEHWSEVFRKKGINEELLDAWLADIFPPDQPTGLPAPTSEKWTVRKKDLAWSIKCARDTAPGPDGIPYTAWRRLGPLALDTLYEAMQALATVDGKAQLDSMEDGMPEFGHSFNLARLCCLPKKAQGSHAEHGEYFTAESTRPIAIVNTDNRLLASACRHKWEKIFNDFVSKAQRGFLHGRSMLDNIIDIDWEAMTISLKHEHGALLLFDFKAAFPSLSQDYMMKVLRHLGAPEAVLHMIGALYHNGRCELALAGKLFPGFVLAMGIRQGCPLSPLLFAVTVDLLLRKLAKDFPEAMVRAFADDTAMCVTNLWRDLTGVKEVFSEFGAISGLHLGLPKTLVVPLWPDDVVDIAAKIATTAPEWTEVKVAYHGKYLGFMEGPLKGSLSWTAPLAKFEDRVHLWTHVHQGLHCAALTYNVFAASVLAFVGQLEEVPTEVLQAETRLHRYAAKGPGGWATSSDLWNLREMGLTSNFVNIEVMAHAAKIRVSTWEARYNGGLKVVERARLLRQCMSNTEYIDRLDLWYDWYRASHVLVLDRALQSLIHAGLSPRSIIEEIAGNAEVPWTQAVRDRTRNHFQRTVASHLTALQRPNTEYRLREKLERWRLLGPAGIVARKVLRRLLALRGLVAPRVAAACFSTIWNRWTTERRFQRRSSASNQCVFGCGGNAEDALEHYRHCAIIRSFAWRSCRIRYGADTFFLAGEGEPWVGDNGDALVLMAITIYASYVVYNEGKHNGGWTEGTVQRALEQAARNAVRGHAHSQRVLDRCWSAPKRGRH
jgi:hypothetical protein